MSQIGGAIIDQDSKPIPGVVVTLFSDNNTQVAQDTTDASGEWFFDNAAAENLSSWIRLNKSGFMETTYPAASAPQIIELDPSEKTILNIKDAPTWVWIALGAAALVVGYVVFKKYIK